jgi:hypothetical protein
MRPTATAFILLVLLTACGGGGPGTPGGDEPPTISIPEPNPLEVRVTLDESRSVARSVPVTGGALSLTDERGATYTLTLPENALLEETEVVMTPIAGLEDSPISGGRLFGVELKPHGLRLFEHATLSIAPPGGGAVEAVGFAAQQGRDFHLYPLGLGADITLELLHFSEYGVFVASETDAIPVLDNPDTFVPLDWEAQLTHLLAEIVRKERRAQLKGEPGDPQFPKKVEAILITFYDKVVEGMLGQIAIDCAYAEANAPKVLAWSRTVSFWGLDEKLAARMRAVMDAVRKGADACWKAAVAPCIDRQDAVQVALVARYARLNLLLGGDPAEYNPKRPDLSCEPGCAWVKSVRNWTGRFAFRYENSGTAEDLSVEVHHSGDVTYQVQWSPTAEGHYRFSAHTLAGTLTTDNRTSWDYHGRRQTKTEQGSGPPVTPSSMTMLLDTATCTFDLEFRLTQQTTVSNSSFAHISQVHLEVFDVPFTDRPGDYTLTAELPVNSSDWSFEAGTSHLWIGSGGMDSLDDVIPREAFGNAQVAWHLAPAP